MPKDQRELLEVLKFELYFLEKGGYGHSVHTPRKQEFIFEDSPSCMNYDSKENKAPCSECVLTQLVPEEAKTEAVPCRHIPLNENGETLHTLYGHGLEHETEEVFGRWLRETIATLEGELENRVQQAKASPPHLAPIARGIALHQNVHPKCANPACPTVFHWLLGGKFFRFSEQQCKTCAAKTCNESKGNIHCVKHFWLCEKCSNIFTLAYDDGKGVMLKLRRTELPTEEARKLVAS